MRLIFFLDTSLEAFHMGVSERLASTLGGMPAHLFCRPQGSSPAPQLGALATELTLSSSMMRLFNLPVQLTGDLIIYASWMLTHDHRVLINRVPVFYVSITRGYFPSFRRTITSTVNLWTVSSTVCLLVEKCWFKLLRFPGSHGLTPSNRWFLAIVVANMEEKIAKAYGKSSTQGYIEFL
jgi:hypothetical protein